MHWYKSKETGFRPWIAVTEGRYTGDTVSEPEEVIETEEVIPNSTPFSSSGWLEKNHVGGHILPIKCYQLRYGFCFCGAE